MLKKVKMPPDTKYSWNLSNSPPEQFFRYAHFDITKAELLQLNRTQFPSLGIFVSKKVGNQKNKTTFIISVLKVVYWMVLVFSISNFLLIKIPREGN